MSFASEFREFAVKGNVVDLAVGVIIGGAFGKIVDSLVKDLIMAEHTSEARRSRQARRARRRATDGRPTTGRNAIARRRGGRE